MTTGELWTANPLFPWLVWILALWILFTTAVMARNWLYIQRLKRQDQFLQSLLIEGIGNVIKQFNSFKEERNQGDQNARHRHRTKRHTKSVHTGTSRIQEGISQPAATEEVRENGNDITVGSESPTEAKSGSPETAVSK